MNNSLSMATSLPSFPVSFLPFCQSGVLHNERLRVHTCLVYIHLIKSGCIPYCMYVLTIHKGGSTRDTSYTPACALDFFNCYFWFPFGLLSLLTTQATLTYPQVAWIICF